MTDEEQAALTALSDDELCEEIREAVNAARNNPSRYDRKRSRAVFEEAARRGWNTSKPNKLTI